MYPMIIHFVWPRNISKFIQVANFNNCLTPYYTITHITLSIISILVFGQEKKYISCIPMSEAVTEIIKILPRTVFGKHFAPDALEVIQDAFMTNLPIYCSKMAKPGVREIVEIQKSLALDVRQVFDFDKMQNYIQRKCCICFQQAGVC